MKTLLGMLSYCRPAGSKGERDFVAKYLSQFPADDAGNRIHRIGDAPVLWSCHTDTVHHVSGRQRVHLSQGGIVSLTQSSASSCLGADDTTGVWLMLEMIRESVPGLYIFHAEEEIGGVGSRHIADVTPWLLDGIKCAIALDRRGQDSVVTHQGIRCCSDSFAHALARQLGGDFSPDSSGIFTDTANYTGLIPECTNISVGYAGAHSPAETLDTVFLQSLRDTLCSLDIASLPIERNPTERDSYYFAPSNFDFARPRRKSMAQVVKDSPEIIADILEYIGYTAETIQDEIDKYFPL